MSELSPYFIERSRPVSGLPETTSAQGPSLRQYWEILSRHLKLIAAVAGAIVTIGALLILTATPIYRATAVILIDPQAPQVLDMKELSVEPPDSSNHDYYKTQYSLLRSRSLAAQVIYSLDLKDNPHFNADRRSRSWSAAMAEWLGWRHHRRADDENESLGIGPRLIDRYLQALTIQPEFGTRLVRISFDSPDAELAARAANLHSEKYLQQGMELRASANEAGEHFLQTKLVDIRERVEKSEAALNAYRHEKGIVEFSTNDQNEMLLKTLEELNSQLTEAETLRIGLEAEAALVKKGDYAALPEVVRSPLVQALGTQLTEIQSHYAEMAARYTSYYAPLGALRSKLRDTRNQIVRTEGDIARSVDLQYSAAVARENEIRKQLNDEKSQALTLNDDSLQDAVLARDVDTNRQLYESVLKRMKEMGVAADVRTTNVSLVDRAFGPLKPSRPHKLADLALSGFFGLLAGLGLACGLEYWDDAFKSSEDVERHLGLPTLAQVPMVRSLATIGIQRYLPGRTSAADDGNGDSAKINGGRSAAQMVEFWGAVESYRAIRGKILLSRAGQPPRSLLITSAVGGEGKSVTAVNTAITFARKGRDVLLIDSDLRRSRSHELLHLEPGPGLAEVLAGQADAAEVTIPTSVGGLYLMRAGATPPDPPELLGSARMSELFAELLERFEYLIVDSAPVNPVSDSVALAPLVDGVLYVVHRNTPRNLAWEGATRLSEAGARILGVVLNGGEPVMTSQYYGYQRGNYAQPRPNGHASAGERHAEPSIIFD